MPLNTNERHKKVKTPVMLYSKHYQGFLLAKGKDFVWCG